MRGALIAPTGAMPCRFSDVSMQLQLTDRGRLQHSPNWVSWWCCRQLWPQIASLKPSFPKTNPPMSGAAAAFPYLGVLVVLPAAAAAAAGVRVPVAAGVLSAEMLWSSGASIWAQLAGLWRHRQRPDELAIKRLAMLGAVVRRTLCVIDGLVVPGFIGITS